MTARLALSLAFIAALFSPGGTARAQECPEAIIETFGYLAHDACYVAWRESTWRPGATGALGEKGYFQIHPLHHDSTYDPYGNALAAYRLSRGGRDWCTHWRWTCS